MISIHALRGEGDRGLKITKHNKPKFLSTPSVGRATGRASIPGRSSRGFLSTPSVGRATVPVGISIFARLFLSTPSVGRATLDSVNQGFQRIFLSTPSVGRATDFGFVGQRRNVISIHALRGEGDRDRRIFMLKLRYFYPRPPWGGRQQKYTKILCSFCAKGTIISPPGGAIRRAAAKRQLQHSTT